MKSSERVKKIRDMSVEELQAHDNSMHEEMLRLRFQWAMGQTESLNKMRELRRDRARAKTILREREKGGQ